MTFRKILFWFHLCIGVTAGAIILTMSVTGILLTYQRQILDWTHRGFDVPAADGARPMTVDAMAEAVASQTGKPAGALTFRSRTGAPVEAPGKPGVVQLYNPYTGALIGAGHQGLRSFFRTVTDWHRWLGQEGEGRAVGRAITGACNLGFLFIVLSGLYLWLPRKWKWQHFRAVLLFRGDLKGQARDFNWHNVIGIWSAIPLALIVYGGVLISYPWATEMLYSVAGNAAPAKPAGGAQASPVEAGPAVTLDEMFRQAAAREPEWQTILVRLSDKPDAPVVLAVDRGNGGRPDLKSQYTFDRQTGALTATETFADYATGRKIRTWFRWMHTGEAGGIPGQTLAGLVTAGAVFLVWTGISLSLRRFSGWRRRRSRQEEAEAAVRV